MNDVLVGRDKETTKIDKEKIDRKNDRQCAPADVERCRKVFGR